MISLRCGSKRQNKQKTRLIQGTDRWLPENGGRGWRVGNMGWGVIKRYKTFS